MTDAIYLEVSEKTEAAKKAGRRVSAIIKNVEILPLFLYTFVVSFL